MGSDICIGMRRSNGDTFCASSYSHVFSRLVAELDLTRPDENALASFIESYRADPSYGPLPVAPFGSGILFFDFQSKTILDVQAISWFPAVRVDDIRMMLFTSPDLFDLYVPNFSAKISFEDIASEVADFSGLKVVTTHFTPAVDRASLWERASIATQQGIFQVFEDGEVRTVARAIVPSGASASNSFLALRFEIPGWELVQMHPNDEDAWRQAKSKLESLNILTEEDEPAWESFLFAESHYE